VGPSDTLRLREGTLGELGYWSLKWEHPDRERPQYRWRTEVWFATEGASVDADIDAQLLDTGRELHLRGIDADRPALVPDLITAFTCKYEEHPLHVKASDVRPAISSTFTKDVILHPQRKLPVVVITADKAGTYAVDPDSLQSRLAGLATVAVYDDDATWTLTDSLGQPMTCFAGAVRIYWPSRVARRQSSPASQVAP